MQPVPPTAEYVPGKHGVMTPSLHEDPAGQSVQLVAPANEVVPLAHSTGDKVTLAQNESAGQRVQPLAPSSAYSPARQGTGATEGSRQEKPAGHVVHEMEPFVE